MILAVLCIVFADVIVKEYTKDISSVQMVFFRSFFGVCLLLVTFFYRPPQSQGGRFGLLVFRGFLGFVNMSIFYYLVLNISLANASVFLQTNVLFGSILSFFILKEKLSRIQVISLVIAFIGVIFVIQPQVSFGKFEILGLIMGITSGTVILTIKQLKDHYGARMMVFSFMVSGLVFSSLAMIIAEFIEIKSLDFLISKFVMPTNKEFIFVFIFAFFSLLFAILRTKAFNLSKVGIIGTISYSRIAFAVIFGVMLGDDIPNMMGISGITLIIISGVLISYNKGKKTDK
ncbi:MAG: Unknown protein [uncultured Campylobacterales bacterium]|uniref:EamA domain-containing protein n=1 Tax=uncultured Campylobacterales bacterium TaxID=352960 RepID=A0A6S6S351_9BACT|nr:MAG: Unknown protein [uncultured Campylobacterales bacterium]